MVLQRNKIMNEKDNKNSLSDLIVGSDTKDDLSVNNQNKKQNNVPRFSGRIL